jgi:hypothetical protein
MTLVQVERARSRSPREASAIGSRRDAVIGRHRAFSC